MGFSISLPGLSGGGGISIGGGAERASEKYGAYQKNIGANLEAFTQGARDAGLHPLFAMGGNAGGAGQMVGGTPDTMGRSITSRKIIRPEEAAFIRESNARTKLLEAQADEIKRNKDTPPGGSGTPSAQNGLVPPPIEQQAGNPIIVANKRMKTGKSLSAQEAEDRGHELAGFFQGLVNMGSDFVENTWKVDKEIDRVMRLTSQKKNQKLSKAARRKVAIKLHMKRIEQLKARFR